MTKTKQGSLYYSYLSSSTLNTSLGGVGVGGGLEKYHQLKYKTCVQTLSANHICWTLSHMKVWCLCGCLIGADSRTAVNQIVYSFVWQSCDPAVRLRSNQLWFERNIQRPAFSLVCGALGAPSYTYLGLILAQFQGRIQLSNSQHYPTMLHTEK